MHVHVFGAVRRGEPDLAPQRPLQQPRAGDVVGVAMRVERNAQCQAELLEQRDVTVMVLEDRVDEHRVTRVGICEQVGVRAGRAVEELTVEHGDLWIARLRVV